MADYQLFYFDAAGTLTGGRKISCRDDADAIELAIQQLLHHANIEVWLTGRMVRRVSRARD